MTWDSVGIVIAGSGVFIVPTLVLLWRNLRGEAMTNADRAAAAKDVERLNRAGNGYWWDTGDEHAFVPDAVEAAIKAEEARALAARVLEVLKDTECLQCRAGGHRVYCDREVFITSLRALVETGDGQ